MNMLHTSKPDLQQLAKDNKEKYMNAHPYPHIVLDNFFDDELLSQVLNEFPDLSKARDTIRFDNQNEKKYGAKGESLFGQHSKLLAHYLNSEPVLEFLQELTGIEEKLLPDPYFVGGGYHEIKPGGLLKIHADFNKHYDTLLDRRINLIVYLNQNWEESFGGHFELWDETMTTSCKKILPIFNRVAIFSTTDFSYHGHPDPLTCPPGMSRKSMALYYYTNGRPASEVNAGKEKHSTLFVARKGQKEDVMAPEKQKTARDIARECVPPIILNAFRKLKG